MGKNAPPMISMDMMVLRVAALKVFQVSTIFFPILATSLNPFFGGSAGGRQRRRGGPLGGEDLQMQLHIEFEEAVFGAEKEISVKRPASCEACDSKGVEKGHELQTCSDCGGAGQLRHVQGIFSMATPCARCRGTGMFNPHPCKACDGNGRVAEEKKLKVNIPGGVETGVQIRLAGEGASGVRGGGSGDLFVVLDVAESKDFRRDGEHLFSQVDVGIAQAALGTEIEITTVDGPETLDIPKGSKGR